MKYKKLILIVIITFAATSLYVSSYAEEFIEPARKDKCPVCGMFVHKYPKWVAEIIFKDGTYAVFDGTKDMLKYYFNISKYNRNKTKEDISEIYVTEYYTTKHMRAKDLFFIMGSDAYGPMGAEAVPVKGMAEAHTFAKDHKGKKMLRFSEITPADLPGMMHKREMDHDKGHDMQEMKEHNGDHGDMGGHGM